MPDFYKEDKDSAGFGHNVTPFPGIHHNETVKHEENEEDIVLHMEDLNLTDFPLNIQNAILNHDLRSGIKERTIEEEKVEISKLLGEIDEELFTEQESEMEDAASYSEIHRAELERLCRESDMEAEQLAYKEFAEVEVLQEDTVEKQQMVPVQTETSEIFAELQRLKQKQIEPEVAALPLPPRSSRKKHKKVNAVATETKEQVIIQEEMAPAIEMNEAEQVQEPAAVYPNVVYAGFWMRMFAYLVDILMVSSFHRIVVNQLKEAANVSLLIGPFSLSQYIQVLVFVLYFVLFTKINNGQTIGKMIFDLRVVSLTGGKLTWGAIFLREGLGRYCQKILLPLYLMVGLTPKKQHLVDMVSKTSVVSGSLVKAYQAK
ncbi:RDD family protein [Isobaculum melis]|uniref:Uncharacterized membrane protein YckC, RDD family n=1 Tax=Isobaculum melis TaxID=142588 RepID=A0A1H9RJV8_9LACT|nr:RDD family protein [Isobaculum melis]SER72984.1 Uncharacterized membrane protein YckC, RDD family [Isobaculum melis]